ncbi:Hypothetical protein IALB_2892 [Ignavibacterium album JCM 16511]|uniref:Uncharacterized protein n=1 Tax=Ignavibacterium album (strain DSM 19864 / JCM 16511 / NBRC 101810 / Mat9-16) TaxID=945713 RepID=I0ANN8_IGNAJ|nr:Hypothetical protein IALB_2892 [Ignavibacterium album JCM 16511]
MVQSYSICTNLSRFIDINHKFDFQVQNSFKLFLLGYSVNFGQKLNRIRLERTKRK